MFFYFCLKIKKHLIMKKVLFVLSLLGVFLALSCEKEEDSDSGFVTTHTPSFSNRVMLNIIAQTDTSVTLRWTKLDSECFNSYRIYREASNDSSNINNYNSIKTFTDANETTYTDTNLMLASTIKYQVYAETCNGYFISNLVFKKRDDIYTIGASDYYDVVFDKESDNIYVLDKGGYYSNDAQIIKVNYKNFDQEVSIPINYNMGFGSIGKYNSSKELYVPSNDYSDRSIYIYDANTLSLKSKFNHGESDVSSVAINNNQLFLGVDDYSYSIKCYSRASFAFIDGLGSFYNESRVKLIPGTTTELFAVENSNEIGYYKFDSNGAGVSHNEEYSGYYPDYSMMEVAPSGDIFITGSRGYVYDKELNFKGSLSYSTNYNSYAFSEDGSKIYACHNQMNQIDVFNSTTLALESSMPTMEEPKRVFVDEGMLILFSRVYNNYGSYTYAIEKININ